MCGELDETGKTANQRYGSSPRVRGTPTSSATVPRGRPVHPRVCGELSPGAAAIAGVDGSSPRVRGTHPPPALGRVQRRFIPACAGNSFDGLIPSEILPVHPRVCGELPCATRRWRRSGGSSPRVRGTPQTSRGFSSSRRFIPACAGNSGIPRRRGRRGPVHPRVCGELVCLGCGGYSPHLVHPRVCGELVESDARLVDASGSSPRVRGTLPWTMRGQMAPQVHPRVCGELPAFSTTDIVCLRFIPACAGNSRSSRRVRRRRNGSSPRVRGTRTLPHTTPISVRFIPACAGNSPGPCPHRVRRTVHPRVCGELTLRASGFRNAVGSSPRVRGTRDLAGGRRELERFIPACAGNSRAAAARGGCRAVHPRVCGELRQSDSDFDGRDGSSPRVRGTRVSAIDAVAKFRFIPACAGNSPRSPRTTAAGARFIPACAGNSRRCRPPSTPSPVHPRVCGELALSTPIRYFFNRFIPACAGNSG